MKPEPFRIEPEFVPRIWGARSLAPLYPEKSKLPEPIGEVWLTGADCKIGMGPFAGKTLGAAWREMPSDWRGTHFAAPADFPILIKFIFPKDKLSIQVHPDDAYAAAHEQAAGGRGKTEMWYIVSAEPGARVLVGLKPDVDKKKFLEGLERNALENLLETLPAHAGDTFFVPCGTPHTIGPNMVICEIQEYSDLTYRVYDYGRVDAQGKPRALHINKALEVLNFANPRGGMVAALQLPAEQGSRMLLAASRYFAAERREFLSSVSCESCLERFELLVVLAGKGYIHWRASSLMYKFGECWLLPASLGHFSLQPEQKSLVIQTYVPNLAGLGADLRKSGVTQDELAHTVFA